MVSMMIRSTAPRNIQTEKIPRNTWAVLSAKEIVRVKCVIGKVGMYLVFRLTKVQNLAALLLASW